MTGAYHRYPCGSALTELLTFKRRRLHSIQLLSPSLLNTFLPSQPQASQRGVQVTQKRCQKGTNWCPNWHSQKTGQGKTLKFFPGQFKGILGQMWKTHKTPACVYIFSSTARPMLLISANYYLLNKSFNKEHQFSLLFELQFSLELDFCAYLHVYVYLLLCLVCRSSRPLQ